MIIAGIDIGTNSVRYLAVETQPSGPPKIITSSLRTPRLGEGLTGTGRLSNNAVDRTISALSLIKNGLESMGVSEFRCVGTEALRLAGNGDIFIRRASEIGLTITILTGEEEARLIYAGATDNLDLLTGGYTLADVGGGSTEIITATKGGEPHFISLPLGCVRLKELSFTTVGAASKHDYRGKMPLPQKAMGIPIQEQIFRPELDRMMEYCRDLLRKKYPAAPAKEAINSAETTLIGLGGTFTTLAAVHLRLTDYDGDQVHNLILSEEEISQIRERMRQMPPEERKQVPGLEPSRADIIIPGIIIVQSIMEHFGFNRVTISDRGILWGLTH
jgi:exopolyphosphatase/guanosine-5'-triphosphate,3'-diphosphate pyrophosphatase